MKNLAARWGIVLSATLASVTSAGCGSHIVALVREGRLAEACRERTRVENTTRYGDAEGTQALREAIERGGEVRLAINRVPAEHVDATLGVALAGAAQPFIARVRVEVHAAPRDARAWSLRSLTFFRGSVNPSQTRLDPGPRRPFELDRFCTAPDVPYVPEPPMYVAQRYEPTPMPRLESITWQVSGGERVVGDLVRAFTLGVMDMPRSYTQLTPAGREAYRRWARENDGARRRFDEQQRALVEANRAERERVRALNAQARAEASAFPARCREALVASMAPRCSNGGTAVAGLLPGQWCEWVVVADSYAVDGDELSLLAVGAWDLGDEREGCVSEHTGYIGRGERVDVLLERAFGAGPRGFAQLR